MSKTRKKQLTTQHITDIEHDKFQIEVRVCMGCGYHLGVDSTYLEQVGSIETKCPSCGLVLVVEGYS